MQNNSLTLSQPLNNCVYQRRMDGYALVPVAGMAPAGVTSLTAVFTAVNGGRTLSQTIPVDATGKFGSVVELLGGLYSLTVWGGTTNAGISRVGAGEVFAAFGHSFLQGGHDKDNQRPATDERVFTLLDTLTNRGRGYGRLTTMVGPFHEYPDWIAPFGDLMVQRLNVPVLVYGCAYGGSNIRQSYELLTGAERTGLPPGTTDPASRQPFLPLERVMADYVPITGIRSLLVEHGYNDRGTSKEDFKTQFRYVMDYVRRTYEKPALSIVLVQEETSTASFTLADPTTGAAQTELIATYPNTFKGPDFNAPYWGPLHVSTGNEHMFGASIPQFGRDWADSLTAGFFAQAQPYLPTMLPDEILPAVLYNAPMSAVKSVDWLIIGAAAAVLVGVYIYQKKYLMWAFLLLGLLALGRFTGKV